MDNNHDLFPCIAIHEPLPLLFSAVNVRVKIQSILNEFSRRFIPRVKLGFAAETKALAQNPTSYAGHNLPLTFINAYSMDHFQHNFTQAILALWISSNRNSYTKKVCLYSSKSFSAVRSHDKIFGFLAANVTSLVEVTLGTRTPTFVGGVAVLTWGMDPALTSHLLFLFFGSSPDK